MAVKVWLMDDTTEPSLTFEEANAAQINQGVLNIQKVTAGAFDRSVSAIVAGRWWRYDIIPEVPQIPETSETSEEVSPSADTSDEEPRPNKEDRSNGDKEQRADGGVDRRDPELGDFRAGEPDVGRTGEPDRGAAGAGRRISERGPAEGGR